MRSSSSRFWQYHHQSRHHSELLLRSSSTALVVSTCFFGTCFASVPLKFCHLLCFIRTAFFGTCFNTRSVPLKFCLLLIVLSGPAPAPVLTPGSVPSKVLSSTLIVFYQYLLFWYLFQYLRFWEFLTRQFLYLYLKNPLDFSLTFAFELIWLF
jgi:hypothetical protein